MKKDLLFSLLFSRVKKTASRFLIPLALLISTISVGQIQPENIRWSDGIKRHSTQIERLTQQNNATSIIDEERNVNIPDDLPGIINDCAIATLSADPSSVCDGGGTKIYMTFNGGTSPYTVTLLTSQGQTTTLTVNSGDFVDLAPIGVGTITVTMTSGTDANGCAIDVTNAQVSINGISKAKAVLSADPTAVCADGVTKIYMNFDGGTAPYTVTLLTSQGQTTTRTVNSGDFVALGPIGVGTLTVTMTSGTDANSCAIDVTNAQVAVNGISKPNAVASPSSQMINSGATITTIGITGDVSGTTFNWTRDNTASVTGIAGFGSGNISGALTNTTNAEVTVTFTITPTVNGCTGTPVTATVKVGPNCVIVCPGNIEVNNDPGVCGAVVNFAASITGQCGTVTYSHAPGSLFPIGTTTVTVSSTAAPSCSFTVKVKDNEPPVINTVANPVVLLWSPNHKYQTINVSQCVTSVTDNCGNIAVSNVKITKVTSDEPENAPGYGDGNTTQDIKIAGNCKSVQLRRERIGGGNGRVYTIHLSVTDSKGNTATATCKAVALPNQSGVTAVDNGPVYTVNSNCSNGINSSIAATSQLQSIDAVIPEGFGLEQNYPNPFNTVTTIRYVVPVESTVSLAVYNNQGQLMAKLADGRMSAGNHQVRFDASKLAAGIYLYRLQTVDANGQIVVINRKMIISK